MLSSKLSWVFCKAVRLETWIKSSSANCCWEGNNQTGVWLTPRVDSSYLAKLYKNWEYPQDSHETFSFFIMWLVNIQPLGVLNRYGHVWAELPNETRLVLVLQAQVSGCISARQWLSKKKRNGKLVMHQSFSYTSLK